MVFDGTIESPLFGVEFLSWHYLVLLLSWHYLVEPLLSWYYPLVAQLVWQYLMLALYNDLPTNNAPCLMEEPFQ